MLDRNPGKTLSQLKAAFGEITRHEKDMVIAYEKPEQVAAAKAKWQAAHGQALGHLQAMLAGVEDKDNAIVRELQKRGAQMKAYDPVAKTEATHLFGHENIQYTDSLEDTVSDVDAVVLLTRWPEFKRVPELLKKLGQSTLMIDGRRMLDKNEFDQYEGIGLQVA